MEVALTAHDEKSCMLCGAKAVELFLDLGETALANQFLRRDEINGYEAKYLLRVGFCHGCAHVQLLEAVPPLAMFENYLYISSASETLKQHFNDLSAELIARYRIGAADLVIDIGCNDGTLLAAFKRHGTRALGVDPAANLSVFTTEQRIERYTGLFSARAAAEIVSGWGEASLITATNTFPHIQDLDDFVGGVKIALHNSGVLVLEMHYLLDLIEQLAFDTIYHEHVSYWALAPMQRLFERHGMKIVDAERVPLHHGQLRVHVQRQGEAPTSDRVARLLAAEKAAGLDRFETYVNFAARVQAIKKQLHATIAKLKREGRRLAAYGAPAKGNTLLSFLDFGPDHLPYIVDRSPLKQGRFTPGTHIPVVGPEQLLIDQPDYVLLLAWNFADEIVEQQAEYRKRGGKFMVPVPEVRVL
jgi:SAM-dependent methyltransferase